MGRPAHRRRQYFNWRTDHDHDARWEMRHYDLDHLASADAVLSYWGSAAIAHAMISFGFDDGSHVVFSVEIRKQRGQQYSAIGGFFKQFETILIAADERDIIRVRTNVRGEDDYLYPLRMDKKVGALDRSVPIDELRRRGRITERARNSRPDENFSEVIRIGVGAP